MLGALSGLDWRLNVQLAIQLTNNCIHVTVPVMLVRGRASTNVITALWLSYSQSSPLTTLLSLLFSSPLTTDNWHRSWQLLVAFSPFSCCHWATEVGGGRVSAPVGAWLSQGRGQTGLGTDGEQMPLCVFYVLFYVCNIVTFTGKYHINTLNNYF